MDIGKLVNYDDAVDYELKSPVNGEGLGVIFKLVHKDSTSGRAAFRSAVKRTMERQYNKKAVFDAEAALSDNDNLTLSCISGWSWGGKSLNGVKDPEFNPTNVRQALDIPWIKDQIVAKIEDIEAFTKG